MKNVPSDFLWQTFLSWNIFYTSPPSFPSYQGQLKHQISPFPSNSSHHIRGNMNTRYPPFLPILPIISGAIWTPDIHLSFPFFPSYKGQFKHQTSLLTSQGQLEYRYSFFLSHPSHHFRGNLNTRYSIFPSYHFRGNLNTRYSFFPSYHFRGNLNTRYSFFPSYHFRGNLNTRYSFFLSYHFRGNLNTRYSFFPFYHFRGNLHTRYSFFPSYHFRGNLNTRYSFFPIYHFKGNLHTRYSFFPSYHFRGNLNTRY